MPLRRRLAYLGCFAVLLSILWAYNSKLCDDKKDEPPLIALPIEEIEKQHSAKQKERPSLGIAFGGGGVRGFMHLGVLKALDEEGIRADVVTGSSAGSMAASLYASGRQYEEIEKIVLGANRTDFVDLACSHQGVIRGEAIAEWMIEMAGKALIEELPIPLGITVTDLSEGRSLLVINGDVGRAVRASVSIPGAFVPVRSNDSTYVDGGVLSLVPVRFTRAMGADVVIGVDIYCGSQPELKDGALRTLYASMRLLVCKYADIEASEADILIRPEFEPKNKASFESRDEAIQSGYAEMKARIPELKKKLGIE